MKKIMVFSLCLLLVGALVLAGCGQSQPEQPAKDSIIIGQAGEPSSLDPQFTADGWAMRIANNIFDRLVEVDEKGNAYPGLAEEWDISPDGMEYTFNLRKGVKFHNGEDLTANDVKFTFERGVGSPLTADVFLFESAEVIDEHTIKFQLKTPHVLAFDMFSQPQFSIVNEKAVTGAGEEFGRKPIGTGPYKLASWDPGVSVTLEANEDYFRGSPTIKRAEFKNIVDRTTGVIALETGEIDMYVDPAAVDVQSLKNNPDITVYTSPSLIYEYFGFNTQKEPFNNKLVRQAIAYAVDQEAILIAVTEGVGGELAATPVSPLSFGYVDKYNPYPYDPQKAKDLLEQAGYPQGFAVKISTMEGPRKKVAEIVQHYLSEIGLQAQVDVLEAGAFIQSVMQGNHEIFVLGIAATVPDVDMQLYIQYTSGSAANFTFYNNSEFDSIMKEARQSLDADFRKEQYAKVQEILYEDLPTIPLYFRTVIHAANKNLKGYAAHPMTWVYLHNLSW